MFFQRKQKATSQQTAVELIKFTQSCTDAYISGTFSIPEGVDRQTFVDEMFYLSVFSVDFSVYNAYGDTPEKQCILDEYYSLLAKTIRKELLGSELKARLFSYTRAVKTPHTNGPHWMIGKTFSELCKEDMNVEVITRGSVVFGTTVANISDFLNKIKK